MPRLILTPQAIATIIGHGAGALTGDRADNVAQFCRLLPAYQEAYGLDQPGRLAPFVAQVAHECDRFNTLREYASGAAYEGRKDLGNTSKGDGPRYRGRGLIQCTGRANYAAFTDWAERRLDEPVPDFVAKPELLETWPFALLSALWFWETRQLNRFADQGDFERMTRKINGGTNGLGDRRLLLGRAQAAIAALLADETDRKVRPDFIIARATIRRGSEGSLVAVLQRGLREHGYPVLVDGDFGPATELAVRMLQGANGLTVDGVVGPRTWSFISPTPGEDPS